MNYKTIYNEYQHSDYGWLKGIFIDNYARIFSPFITMVALKLKMIPNVVTLCMIIFGIIGAVLFAMPQLWCKILGTFFIHLWYITDLSDGEVARITKRFSKYGTDIDYYAHMINHPLYIAAFGYSFIQLGYDTVWVLIAMFVYVTAELSIRMIYALDLRHQNDQGKSFSEKITLKYLVKFFTRNLFIFPNIALVYPIIFLFSSELGWYVFIGLSILNIIHLYVCHITNLSGMLNN